MVSVSKKRNWEGGEEVENKGFYKESKLERTTTTFDIDLHLDTPLPFEWQRCLDIKSGQIHFYNTRTRKRTSRDPRWSSEATSFSPSLDLDLELNLKCVPLSGLVDEEDSSGGARCDPTDVTNSRGPFCVSLDAVDNMDMVAAVCVRCHMLVMMCKAAPSCPNCKYVDPPIDQASPGWQKTGFRLLCYKD